MGLRRSRTTLYSTSEFDRMGMMGLRRSRTTLSEMEPRYWRKTLHAQRPISRSATDLRPMREDSFFCVTNFYRARPKTTAGSRSGDCCSWIFSPFG